MQCQVGLYFLSNSFLMYAAMSFSMLYFSMACAAQSMASCCMSSDMSAFLTTAFLSDMVGGGDGCCRSSDSGLPIAPDPMLQGCLAHKKPPPPRTLQVVTFSYERGTPVTDSAGAAADLPEGCAPFVHRRVRKLSVHVLLWNPSQNRFSSDAVRAFCGESIFLREGCRNVGVRGVPDVDRGRLRSVANPGFAGRYSLPGEMPMLASGMRAVWDPSAPIDDRGSPILLKVLLEREV
eukprot:CAMPEP_0180203258 /NCGR_PEP_ID=MMETSP0987-20121128/7752_1 /TAXON_ID=697907 /ORGANISM="non described non described, Strain CCMP2293" /LENGTH=234 /DNA_ID=CAMNT_0022158609 /DNA_START=665 /DNA_END=1370 /DNA_ORIENTATION=-